MDENHKFVDCTGIAVIKGGRVLLGLRQDGQGWGLAGGKRDIGETLEECAKRELQEEFGIEATNLEYIGAVEAEAKVKGKNIIVQPSIYICKHYSGKVRIDRREHIKYTWLRLDEALKVPNLFPPSRRGIELILSTNFQPG